MSLYDELPDDQKGVYDKMIESSGPEFLERFGDPRNDNDPRNWSPEERIERGIDLQEQVRLLGLDLELQGLTIANIVKAQLQQRRQQMLEEFQKDPAAAIRKMIGGDLPVKGAYGPLEDHPDASIRYAGSTGGGLAPDVLIETPQGLIRADEIPGYVNDPKWKPSPDWVDANCMCPVHQETRKLHNGGEDNGFGMYL